MIFVIGHLSFFFIRSHNLWDLGLTTEGLGQWYSTGVDFVFWRTIDKIWRYFCLSQLEVAATGV